MTVKIRKGNCPSITYGHLVYHRGCPDPLWELPSEATVLIITGEV